MITRGQLGDDTAEFGMQRDLAVHGVADQAIRAVIHSDTGFITGSLDPQHSHVVETFAFAPMRP